MQRTIITIAAIVAALVVYTTLTAAVGDPPASVIDSIKTVHEFYYHAWTQLVVTVTILFTVGVGVVGVVMPILLRRWQQESFKLQVDGINEKFKAANTKIDQLLVTLRENVTEMVDGVRSQLDEKFERSSHLLHGGMFQVQASTLVEHYPAHAAVSYASAVSHFARAGERRNMRAVLASLPGCLSRLNATDAATERLDDRIVEMASQIEGLKDREDYAALLGETMAELERAKGREGGERELPSPQG